MRRIAGAYVTDFSHRFLKLEDEIIDRHRRLVTGEAMCIVRLSPEIAFGNEVEARRLHFLPQGAFLDAMQGFTDRYALTGSAE